MIYLAIMYKTPKTKESPIMFSDNENIEKFNKLANNVSQLADTGTTLSQQVFSLMRQVSCIEKQLVSQLKNFKAYEESEDEAAIFVNNLANEDISLDDLDTDIHKRQ